jgi:hypothetical protein
MAFSTVMVFAFAAMVVDLAQARDVRRQSQNASDASALAAGNALYLAGQTPDIAGAVSAAKSYAQSNYGISPTAWASCTDSGHLVVPTGGSQCISFSPNLTKPTTVRVLVPARKVQTPFATVLGVRDVNVGSLAHAAIDPGGASRCGLCVLGEGSTHDLQNGDATVHGADIHFNGNVNVGPNGLVATDGNITVQGSASGSYVNYVPDPQTNQPPIKDPLASFPLPPDLTGLTAKSDPCGTGATHGPGIYGGRNLRNNTCTLEPGLYVIAGDSGTTWDLAGNSSTLLTGTGVTLYFMCGSPSAPRACNAGEQGANMDASGNGFIGIQAPTSGPLQGLAIVYDRKNTSMLRLTGNGSDNLTGTIYMAEGSMQMNGNGCAATYNALIIIKDLEMNGNPSCLQSSYAQSKNVQIPPQALHLSR